MITVRARSGDGSTVAWLDQLGQLSQWQHTKTNPGGPSSASFQFAADQNLAHPCLQGGATLDAYSGTKRVWRGRLDQPQRGLPWQCTATGAAALAKDYQAHVSSANIYIVDDTIDQAISDGLPWVRNSTLQNPATTGLSLTADVDGVLGTLVSQGYYWHLDNDSVITTTASLPAASLLLLATNLPPRTLDGYITSIAYIYVDSSGTPHKTIVNTDASLISRYGVVQQTLDLSNNGPLTSTQASNIVTALLGKYATVGLPWSGGFTILPGQLFTLGGTQITDLAAVDANVTLRVVDVNPDDGLTPRFDVPIGQVDYDAATGGLTATPMGAAQDSWIASIARARKIKLKF